MRIPPVLAMLTLFAFSVVAPAEAQVASAASSAPVLFRLPREQGLRCIGRTEPLGSNAANATIFEFEVPGEVTSSRELMLAVDSTGKALALSDADHAHSTLGDTSVGTLAFVFWVRGERAGRVAVTRVSLSAIRAKVEADVMSGRPFSPPNSGTTRSEPERALADSEMADAERLAAWLHRHRCPIGPPTRPPGE